MWRAHTQQSDSNDNPDNDNIMMDILQTEKQTFRKTEYAARVQGVLHVGLESEPRCERFYSWGSQSLPRSQGNRGTLHKPGKMAGRDGQPPLFILAVTTSIVHSFCTQSINSS